MLHAPAAVARCHEFAATFDCLDGVSAVARDGAIQPVLRQFDLRTAIPDIVVPVIWLCLGSCERCAQNERGQQLRSKCQALCLRY